jgi:hypothetical protein
LFDPDRPGIRGIRIAVDWPNVAAGIVPPEGSYGRRFALHPILLYAHILPGVVYLVAPFQLRRSFRERHFSAHRRMGRVMLPAGIIAGIFAIMFGILFPFGGPLEASATVMFGGYFVTALVPAVLAIRDGDPTLESGDRRLCLRRRVEVDTLYRSCPATCVSTAAPSQRG